MIEMNSAGILEVPGKECFRDSFGGDPRSLLWIKQVLHHGPGDQQILLLCAFRRQANFGSPCHFLDHVSRDKVVLGTGAMRPTVFVSAGQTDEQRFPVCV